MIDKRNIAELRDRLTSYERPLLSLYATVNPAHNNPQAIYLRVKNSLKELDGLPDAIAERVLSFFDGRAHDSRTLALFASGDRLEYTELEVELPELADGSRVEARWGEPYLTPLLAAMDAYAAHGVAFVDRDHLRFFHVTPGAIEEILTEDRPLGDERDDEIQSAKQEHPEYVAARGGAEPQLAQEHVREHQRAFYRDMAARVAGLCSEQGLSRLILMGPQGDTHMMLSMMPSQLAGRVKAVVAGPSSPKASTHEIFERLQPTLEELEADRERELLDRVRERGMWGLDQCLQALQQGQLYAVAVPEHALHHDVYVDSETHYVALNPDEARARITNGGRVEKTDLADELPQLASTWGAQVEFLHGDAEKRLLDEFDGMAGLRRW